MRRIQNQDELFIMNTTIATHSPHGTSFGAAFTGVLEDGEIALVNTATNAVHNGAFPTTGRYRFYARNGSTLLMSNEFDASTTSMTVKAYTAPVQQVDYVGYNGTSGSLDASTAKHEIFTLHTYIKGTTRTDFNQAMVKEGHYITTSTTTAQWAIAQGLTRSLIANFSRFPNPVMRFERVFDEVSNVAGTEVNNTTFTYGSNVVTCAGDVDDATGAGSVAIAAGVVVRAGLLTTSPVYFVTAVDTTNNTFTIDVPYQGATVTLDDDEFMVSSNAVGIAAEWGLKLTGIAQPYSTQKYPHQVVSWDGVFTKIDATGKEETPTAVVTKNTTPVVGSGTYAQVAEMERELQMGDGYQLYSDIPMHADYRQQAVAANTYNLVHIKHVKNMTSHIGQEVPSLCGITLALDTGLTYGTTNKTYTVAFTAGTEGAYTITVGGLTLYQNWDTNTDTTHAAFVTAHAAALLAAGITVTYTAATDTLNFVGSDAVMPNAPILINVSNGAAIGDYTATVALSAVTGWRVVGTHDDANVALHV